ncbi:lipid II:glycine glycyltransferase FemX [Calderihabitans maritimus]|uniref:BioF2-like acetyltransferase domain-containing protein n=1 Tax=Calderihabitans maritimus TaxID=1246530 RepID=A0A1Z5HUT4_9FIRM|nr:GNAT family N-acetyltransferase [Calderihabitans maritimus]GAW93296.1 hypothetical protein PTH_1099 [Calderihabitans maritimus]
MYRVYSLAERQNWEEAVARLKARDISYFPGYCRLFQEHGEGQAMLFEYEEHGNFVLYPFFLRDISLEAAFRGKLKESYFDTVTPYGYGGPLASDPEDRQLIVNFRRAFQDYCRKKRIVAEFIRFHPLLGNHAYPYEDLLVERNKEIVCVDLERSAEEIWSNYRRNNRKNIKKALREGLEVTFDFTGETYREFIQLYYLTMDRREARDYYYFDEDFFRLLHQELAGNFLYVYALYRGTAVSAELVLYSEDYLHSFLGGTLEEYFPLRPNNLLKHRLIEWARQKGLKSYILGGGYQKDDGILRFKKSFARDGVIDFYVGKKLHDPEVAEWLCSLRKGEPLRTDFFPAYRG